MKQADVPWTARHAIWFHSMNLIFYVPKSFSYMCYGHSTTSYDDGLLTCSQFSKTDGNVNWSSKNPKHVSFIELQWVAHKMLFEFLYFYFVLWNDRAIWWLSQEIKFQRSSPYLNRYKNMFINIASNDLFAFLSHIFLSLIRFFTLYGHKKMPRLNDDMVRWNCISILTLFWTENFQLIIKFLNLSILP